MNIAYEEAEKAFELGEIPVGCVIVKDNMVLARTHNLKENNNCFVYAITIIDLVYLLHII